MVLQKLFFPIACYMQGTGLGIGVEIKDSEESLPRDLQPNKEDCCVLTKSSSSNPL